jgi:hypothetical protein
VHQDHRSLEHIDLPHGETRHLSPHLHHHSHARPGVRPFPGKLYVVSVISNPELFRARFELALAFQKHMADSGAQLLLVEAAMGGREFELTQRDNPWHLQLRTHDHQHLWIKEAMISAGIAHLAKLVPDWEYAAWIDADITFLRTDWVDAALQSLQHHEVIQPFRYAYHLGPEHQILETHQSFCYCYSHGVPESHDATYNEPASKGVFWHPGFAWAARRSFFQKTGGVIDFSCLGSADHLAAKGLIGRIDEAYPAEVSEGFKRQAHRWQELAKAVNKNIGAIEGAVAHSFHGTSLNRRYRERWSYLTAGYDQGLGATVAEDGAKFNPETDLIRDHQGLWQLHPNKITLRDGMREYFRNRRENLGHY